MPSCQELDSSPSAPPPCSASCPTATPRSSSRPAVPGTPPSSTLAKRPSPSAARGGRSGTQEDQYLGVEQLKSSDKWGKDGQINLLHESPRYPKKAQQGGDGLRAAV